MDIQTSKEVWITRSSIKFTGHSYTPPRRHSDSYWSFGLVKKYELLDPALSLQDIHILHRKWCSNSYWSFGPVMNNLLLNQTNFYWTLPDVRQTVGMTDSGCSSIINKYRNVKGALATILTKKIICFGNW